MLVLQIAAGIVLAVLILRNLSAVVGMAGWLIVMGALIALAVVAWAFVYKHKEMMAAAGIGIILVIVCVALPLFYSVRGLGWLFVRYRPALRRSPRLQRAMSIFGVRWRDVLGIEEGKAFQEQIGGAIFFRLLCFVVLYFLVEVFAAMYVSSLIAPGKTMAEAAPLQRSVAWLAPFLLSLVAYTVWIMRAPRGSVATS